MTIDELHGAKVPHIVVNGRMSERSFKRWRPLGGASRRVFGRVGKVLAQTEADARRFAALGVASVEVVGNLKFDAPPPASDPTALAAIRAAIGNRSFWLAASTHSGEEAIAADVHRRFVEAGVDLVTAIAPRHPERGPEIATELEALGLTPWLKSRGSPMPAHPSILVFDTLGELGTLYRAAPVTFVGGSLVERGGQNPIEPAHLGAAILHGPMTANFSEVYAALDEAGGAITIVGPDDLVDELRRLLADQKARRHQVETAADIVGRHSGALNRTMAAIEPYLPGVPAVA